MSPKRAILEFLTRDELISIADAFDLQVDDRRVRAKLVEAAASSKKATLEAFLPDLSRDRLKELCRFRFLDDAGREKAPLIERLCRQRRRTRQRHR